MTVKQVCVVTLQTMVIIITILISQDFHLKRQKCFNNDTSIIIYLYVYTVDDGKTYSR